jgi:hypothetical protein
MEEADINLSQSHLQKNKKISQARKIRCWLGLLLSILGLAVIVSAYLLLSIHQLPKPTGPYSVGRIRYHWVDKARPEIFSPVLDDKRELAVTIWYPASSGTGMHRCDYADYADNAMAIQHLAGDIGLPGRWFHYLLHHIHPYARIDALLASGGPFPVLIFSHGFGSLPEFSTALIEDLSSHGYVIAGVNHAYASLVCPLSNGRSINFDPLIEQPLDKKRDELIQVLADDIRYVLTQIVKFNISDSSGRFSGMLDMNRVGVFGHSIGGEAATVACSQDSRFRVGLSLDSNVGAHTRKKHIQVPFLFLRENWINMVSDDDLKKMGSTREKLGRQFIDSTFDCLESDGYIITVNGFQHYDFTDAPLVSPLFKLVGITGQVDALRSLRIVNEYSLALFDRYLKNIDSQLLKGSLAKYPEIVFIGKR